MKERVEKGSRGMLGEGEKRLYRDMNVCRSTKVEY